MKLLNFTVDLSKLRIKWYKKETVGRQQTDDFSLPSERRLHWEWFVPVFVLSFQTHRSNYDVFWSVSQQVNGQARISQTSSCWVTLPASECTCVRVWWQMRGGAHRDGADNLKSLSSGRLNLTWALVHVAHTHRPHTQWDSLVIYQHS